MAFLFKQKKSRFWWIQRINPATGKVERKSTKLVELVRARKLCAEYTGAESILKASSPKEVWDCWVEPFFEERYGRNKGRIQTAWRMLSMFLREHELFIPRNITREHSTQYLLWRQQPNKSIGKYKVCRNTIILEIKFMGIILNEALDHGYISSHPWLRLKLHRDPAKEKPELTRNIMAKMLQAIRKEPQPLRRFFEYSFLISRYHGCRLRETHLNPMTSVEIRDQPIITFITKGNRTHTVFLHPKLIRRFRKMQAEQRTETYAVPKNISSAWFKFLTRAGIKDIMPNACHHSLRVTVATTFARQGIEEKKAMRYLNHASTTVHRSYVRLKPDDLSACTAALK